MMARKKKKILYLITKSNWGGAQRYVHSFATSLPKDEFEVVVALGGTGEKDASFGLLAEKLLDSDIQPRKVEAFMRDISVWKDIAVFFELLCIFRTERPEVIHLNSSKAGGIGAIAGRIVGAPNIIFTSHGLAYDEDRNVVWRFFIWIGTWITFMLCHHIIVISKDTYRRARKFWRCSKKVHLVHIGIVPLALEHPTREEARQHLRLPQNAFVIGTIAELTRNKDLTTLIKAASMLKQSGHQFLIAIIGKGEDGKKLEALIEKEKLKQHVQLLGFVPNASRYLKAFDIFVLPSLKEGLPYVLLEAGQAELPAVGSNIAGIEDIIVHKKTGLLFNPKNANDLAAKLERLVQNAELRHQLGQSLSVFVEREFSSEKMVQETLNLYNSHA